MKAIEILFQPTLPTRGATDGIPVRAHDLLISTHAPRTGSDGSRRRHLVRVHLFQPTLPARGATAATCTASQASRISTHAPRTGSDVSPDGLMAGVAHFNPRSPHGERR